MARRAGKAAPAAATAPEAARYVPTNDLPWFPFHSESVHVKLCRVNRATGEMAMLIRVQPGGGLDTHYFHGVAATYCVSGSWRYRGAPWIAGPGDVTIQPAGSLQAIETIGERPAEAFVHLIGAIEFRDEAGKTLCIENAETLHGRYLAHCALHGLPVVDVTT